MSRKKPFNLDAEIRKVLRELSVRWPAKKTARDNAKREVQVGTYKNGKPKYKMMYECASCHNLFDREDTQMDHIKTVIPINIDELVLKYKSILSDSELLKILGRDPGDTDDLIKIIIFISRLFTTVDNYQCLCKETCHKEKTKLENRERRKKRAKKS